MKKERDVEKWLRPIAAPVLMPGYQRQLIKNSRLFFDLYWQLQVLGLSEQQLADHTLAWKFHHRGIPEEVAITLAVFQIARQEQLEVPDLSRRTMVL